MDIEKLAKKNHILKHPTHRGKAWYEEQHIDHLQAYTNAVIEECASKCESIQEQDYCVDVRDGADEIRKLKVEAL